MKDIFREIAQDFKLNGGRLYVVGGYVRDKILGLNPKDIDFVYIGVHPQKAIDILEDYGHVAVDLISNAFVVAVHIDNEQFEFAAARSEQPTGQGKNDVSFSLANRLIEDAMRRDFTINSIYIDVITEEVLDFFNGVQHLEEKTLVPNSQFYESAERINRTAAFASRFEFDVSDSVYQYAQYMDPFSVPDEQHWVQGWEKWASLGIDPIRGLEVWHVSGWGEKRWPYLFSFDWTDLREVFADFNAYKYLEGRDRLIATFGYLRRVNPEGVDTLLEDIRAPNRIRHLVWEFDKPVRREFMVKSNRALMEMYPTIEPGKWISKTSQAAYDMACQLVMEEKFGKYAVDGIINYLKKNGFYDPEGYLWLGVEND